jgi:hypothetical protein
MNERFRQRQTEALDKLSAGTYGTTGEVLNWSYYDETDVPATAGTISLFQIPVGGTKTIAKTNMSTAGQIPTGQKFIVSAIKVMYRSKDGVSTPAEANELNALFDNTIIQFRISNKAPMMQVKLSELMGMSLLSSAHGTAGAVTQYGVFGGVWKMKKGITLAGLTPFSVEVINVSTPAASVASDTLTISLHGTLIRAL